MFSPLVYRSMRPTFLLPRTACCSSEKTEIHWLTLTHTLSFCQSYISFTLFLFPQMYLLILPYSNVVPAPESHRSVASLLSSQSRIPFSGRYKLVKLHGFIPPIFIPSISGKTKAP